MYQFRELFVQEVFENKKIPTDKIFIDKKTPLSKSKIASLKTENNYWVNSPLKSLKQ